MATALSLAYADGSLIAGPATDMFWPKRVLVPGLVAAAVRGADDHRQCRAGGDRTDADLGAVAVRTGVASGLSSRCTRDSSAARCGHRAGHHRTQPRRRARCRGRMCGHLCMLAVHRDECGSGIAVALADSGFVAVALVSAGVLGCGAALAVTWAVPRSSGAYSPSVPGSRRDQRFTRRSTNRFGGTACVYEPPRGRTSMCRWGPSGAPRSPDKAMR